MAKKLKISNITPKQVASLCDHTYLNRPEAFRGPEYRGMNACALRRLEFQRFLSETVSSPLKPYAVCVRAEDVAQVRRYLDADGWKDCIVVATVGFPDGGTPTAFKVSEAALALAAGAKEIDTVLDVEAFKGGDFKHVAADISAVVKVVHLKGALLKLILETSELTLDEIERACTLAEELGVDFVKTSTGFSSSGAGVKEVQVMKRSFSGGIKISGGVKADNVKALLAACTGSDDIVIDPKKIRIGESSLLKQLTPL